MITRPAHQLAKLTEQLTAINCQPIAVPVIDIVPLSYQPKQRPDKIIFVSVNAVTQYHSQFQAPQCKAFTVGPSSAQACLDRGFTATYPLHQYDSEGLLALPQLQADQLVGQTIALVKGEGGRQLLANALTERGAVVEEYTVYRRQCPDHINTDALLTAQAVWVGSAQSFANLYQLASEIWHHLATLIWMVPSQRVAEQVRPYAKDVRVARSALNEDVIALCQEIINDHRQRAKQ